MTEADMIRGLLDEQLSYFIAKITDCEYCPAYQDCAEDVEDVKGCDEVILEWLKQEHKEHVSGSRW